MNPLSPTVILGGGFTGLLTALHLCHHRHSRPIVLIEQADRFVFKPLLYELLSGEMSDSQVQPRYAKLLDCDGITFVQDTVQGIDLHQRQVKLASGLQYSYGHLVLALGSTTNYFGIPGAEDYTFAFRTGEDALSLGRHLRACLQQASQTDDLERRRVLLTVAIAGAGPSGVEMAATLADLLPQWYCKLNGNPEEIQIFILNRSKEILKGDINSHLREVAEKALKKRTIPVQLVTEATVSAIHPECLQYKQQGYENQLDAATIIWTAGTAVHPLLKQLDIPADRRDRSGRLRITPTMQLPDFPEVFVGGDNAALDMMLPATAQVAYQQGATIAHNVMAMVQNKPLKPVKVTLRGTLMKLGLGEAAANLFDRFIISGRSGHLIRQGTYLELLPTPVHNFKATVDWLTDEIFSRHSQPNLSSQPSLHLLQRLGDIAAVLVVISSSALFWRAIQPNQFSQVLQPTGLPVLLDQLQQSQ
ncbi:NAD(P)/FAD-dependent oxidoreductase [Leptolyngbya sp. FACHB-541]|uniref:NAD(P)/FAD-dependent oxidoreductase n=1 Tax=Leptolyngbya sp. FACHB-541 TaxID=2692810 RepID=UPI001684E7FD|nr:NAD(P)/FAD-dependent oxidoreductase [Leptolyngbya sp. FACHB-541]MBD2000077.1 NAD(P)/FAD-dependent oxidoreductase [Leptolyngbya sp. FACHB-541]